MRRIHFLEKVEEDADWEVKANKIKTDLGET